MAREMLRVRNRDVSHSALWCLSHGEASSVERRRIHADRICPHMTMAAITGANAGGPRQLAFGTGWPAVSFIVPAHNEEACLGETLQAIHDSARTAGQPYEIVVAN